MADPNQIRLGLTGMGGFAGYWLDNLTRVPAPHPQVQLAAVCEPNLTAHSDRAQKLRAAGITVVEQFDDLLDQPIDAVLLPLPIDLHRTFTEKALSAGNSVIVEKPAAGSIDDVDAMIAAKDRSMLRVTVGFQIMHDPATWEIKRRLLAGAIGKLISASIICCWQRPQDYYARNTWAGKFKRNGVWVMDSPANNALSHPLNQALFLLGPNESTSAIPSLVEAELYRANNIENYDTCCIRYTLSNDVKLITCFSHACRETVEQFITITGEKGTMRFTDQGYIEMTSSGEQRFPVSQTTVRNVLNGLIPGNTEVATLEIARAHILAVNAASEASPIHTIPETFIDTVFDCEGHPARTIKGIEHALLACSTHGRLLAESDQIPWVHPAGKKNLHGYNTFAGPFR